MRRFRRPDLAVTGVTRIFSVALVACVACGMLAGCGVRDSGSHDARGETFPPVPSVGAAGGPSGLVDIGDGRDIYVDCRGSGSPTVVLIAGAGAAGDSWRYAGSMTDEQNPASENEAAVFQTTSSFTRVCTYDRPGTAQITGAAGRSTPVAQPVTTQEAAADLHRLLVAADVREPVVLVAHSMGGLVATTYARTYPEGVAGLVLVDAASQFLPVALEEGAWTRFVDSIAATSTREPAAEAPDYVASIESLNALGTIPPIPVVVLSSDRPFFAIENDDGVSVDHTNEWMQAQRLLAASLGAPLISETDSGHYIAIENAALVNAQICAIVKPPQGC